MGTVITNSLYSEFIKNSSSRSKVQRVTLQDNNVKKTLVRLNKK